MRNRVFLLVFSFCLLALTSRSQDINVGAQIGSNASFIQVNEEFTLDGAKYSLRNENGNLGFKGGFFLEVRIGKVVVQPEFLFTQTRSTLSFQGPDRRDQAEIRINNLEIPFMAGYQVLKFMRLYGGFTVSYPITVEQVVNQSIIAPVSPYYLDHSFRYSVGVGFDYERLRLDFRYGSDIGSANGSVLINNEFYPYDYRSHKISVQLGLRIFQYQSKETDNEKQ